MSVPQLIEYYIFLENTISDISSENPAVQTGMILQMRPSQLHADRIPERVQDTDENLMVRHEFFFDVDWSLYHGSLAFR
jgi:hypothetical protein